MKAIVNWFTSLFIGFALVSLAAPTTAATLPAKYHPGHYYNAYPGQDLNYILALIAPHNFVGVNIRYYWKDIEPTKGNYNFSGIARDLALAKAVGKQVILQVESSGFSSGPQVPLYLRTPEYGGGFYQLVHPTFGTSWPSKRWNPAVVARLRALYFAIGARFDKDPTFEGLGNEESAIGIPPDQYTVSGYTPDKYVNACKAIIAAGKAALPNSYFMFGLNSFSGNGPANLAILGAYANSIGVGFTGPNTNVDNRTAGYVEYRRYAGTLRTALNVEYGDYDKLSVINPGTRNSPQELLNFSKSLGVDYFLWVPRPPFFENEVIPVVNQDQ